MKNLQIIIDQVKPLYPRPYKGGIELRGINFEQARDQIQKIIDEKGLPVEVFDMDTSVRSISIREKSVTNG